MLSSFLLIGLLEVKCVGSPSALVAHVPIHAPVTLADEKKNKHTNKSIIFFMKISFLLF